MIHLYITENSDVKNKLNNILMRHIAGPIEILKTENGKPYLKGNGAYFSLSHSKNLAAVAVSDSPVGVDLEVITKNHTFFKTRFSEREQSEIIAERDFLVHWTAREAFIKLNGYTLAEYLLKLEYYGGNLYLNGDRQTIPLRHFFYENAVFCVCGEGVGVTVHGPRGDDGQNF